MKNFDSKSNVVIIKLGRLSGMVSLNLCIRCILLDSDLYNLCNFESLQTQLTQNASIKLKYDASLSEMI